MRAARKIRFGVVGAGLWGEVHAKIYSRHPYAELAAVCDADAARARKVAGAYVGVRAYTDFRELVRDPRVVLAIMESARSGLPVAVRYPGQE